jgi:DNA-binding transcriptional LysR family regulator
LVEGARAVLRPVEALDLVRLVRQFTLRSSEGFVETFGPRLLALVGEQAPGVTLQFMTKPDKDSAPLREGDVDLETGVIDAGTAPELRAVPLFRDRWIGVVRGDHQLAMGHVAAESFVNSGHIHVLRRGLHSNEVDEAARVAGLERRIVTVVSGFSSALALVRETDMIATVPDRHTLGLRKGLHSFELPFGIAPFTISMLWHPRMDGDQAHRWLRAQVRTICAGQGAVGS